MCDACDQDPMKWTIVEGDDDGEGARPDVLRVPAAEIVANAPAIEGWELYGVDVNFFDPRDSGVAKTFLYRQKTPMYFVVPYTIYEQYGGPEEGGWWYYPEEKTGDPITIVPSDRTIAESICRSLNRLARKQNERTPDHRSHSRYPRQGFAVDRWPGQNDTSNVRHHYC